MRTIRAMRIRYLIPVAAAWVTTIALLAQGNPEAAKVKNPVDSTPDSIAAGKQLYTRNCAACHGVNATGGTGNDIAPPSPDLTDAEWLRGGSDGEIFDVIKNGIPPDLNMPAWGDRLKDPDMWNLVNFVKSLKK